MIACALTWPVVAAVIHIMSFKAAAVRPQAGALSGRLCRIENYLMGTGRCISPTGEYQSRLGSSPRLLAGVKSPLRVTTVILKPIGIMMALIEWPLSRTQTRRAAVHP